MIVTYLFYLLIFAFSLGQIGRIDFGSGVVLNVTDILLTITLFIWVFKEILIKRDTKLFKNCMTIPIGLFIGVCLVSLLISILNFQVTELIFSSFYLVRWGMYSAVFFMVYSFSSKIKVNIIKCLILSQMIFIIFGFIQYLFYPNLRNLYYLGWDDHLYRLFSTFLDPNFAATQINLFLLLLLTIIKTRNLISSKYKNLLIMLFGLSFIAMIFTYSRSGYLMFMVSMFTNLWLLKSKRIILLLFSLLVIGVIMIPKNLGSAGVELWRTASISARTESARQAIMVIKDNPVLGVGFNTYRYIQRKYNFTDDKTWVSSHSAAGTDNSFLFILATTGIIGFSIYIYMWFVVLKNNYIKYKRIKGKTLEKNLSILIIASIFGLFANSFFINALFYPSIMFWIWTLIGLNNSSLEKA